MRAESDSSLFCKSSQNSFEQLIRNRAKVKFFRFDWNSEGIWFTRPTLVNECEIDYLFCWMNDRMKSIRTWRV